MPLHCPKEKEKEKQSKYKIRKIKEKKHKNCWCPKCPITVSYNILAKVVIQRHVAKFIDNFPHLIQPPSCYD